jgi:H+/Cl- antiporter ClcA
LRPLFGFCFPCCFLFAALGIVAVIAVAAGWGKVAKDDATQPAGTPRFDGPGGPPPWWVMVLIVVVLTVVMWLLYEWNKEY